MSARHRRAIKRAAIQAARRAQRRSVVYKLTVLGWAFRVGPIAEATLVGLFPRAMVHGLGERLRAAREALHVEHTPHVERQYVPLQGFTLDLEQGTFTTPHGIP